MDGGALVDYKVTFPIPHDQHYSLYQGWVVIYPEEPHWVLDL